MFTFIVRRIFSLFVVLLVAVSASFCLLRLAPGNPFAQGEKAISEEQLQAQERKYDLDGSIPSQLGRYIGVVRNNEGRFSGLLQGDFQPCLKYKDREVRELIDQTIPVSATLGAVTLLLATVVGITLGSMAALKKDKFADAGTMFFALFAVSLPTFVVGPALILVFALWLGWLPVGGWSGVKSMILPAVTLAGPFIAYISRLTRTSMLEVLGQDFVRTARAKGLEESRVIYRHALKVAILPVVSFVGPLAANLVTGSLVIESVFNLPGMGGFFVNSVLNRDVFLCCGTVVIYCTLLVLLNLVVDIAYKFLDPRIKLDE
jgi:oligopeptide transport system permease protein